MPNKLINEKSPYLLLHANNPVDWYPWGNEAFDKAKNEDKPIFLSIGYSSCHWCHVMEGESFEDDETAKILNENFISIKVDREERPDIDSIYMNACQALTGAGGWPLTIFMDYNKMPFFAGTYFPKINYQNLPSFTSILNAVKKLWDTDREKLKTASQEITNSLLGGERQKGELKQEIIDEAYNDLKSGFDNSFGGFGRSPKFPSPGNLLFLLRYYSKTKNENALKMVEKTLDSMYRGGIYDHVGFGFCRYSTDRKWHVPHFEKMLYDNALLLTTYTECYQVTHKPIYGRVAREIAEYVLWRLSSPEGGFYCSEDADSEGVEGKFYLWSAPEIKYILGESEGHEFCRLYNISEESIPNLIGTSEIPNMKEAVSKLFAVRENRVHPALDDKILASWNGLIISALALAGRVFKEKSYLQAAERAAEFVLTQMVENKLLISSYRNNMKGVSGFADDYAYMVAGLIDLYQASYKPEYLQDATTLHKTFIEHFEDKENGGFFIYGNTAEQHILRPKEIYDGAMPSYNSVAAMNALRLARLTGDTTLNNAAEAIFSSFAYDLAASPSSYSYMISAFLFHNTPPKEVVLVPANDKEWQAMTTLLGENYLPFVTTVVKDEEEYKKVNSKTTAYVCENFSCKPPTNNVSQLKSLLLS